MSDSEDIKRLKALADKSDNEKIKSVITQKIKTLQKPVKK